MGHAWGGRQRPRVADRVPGPDSQEPGWASTCPARGHSSRPGAGTCTPTWIRWNRQVAAVLWPTLSAGWWDTLGWHPGLLGTIPMRSAGCCVNDVADRDFDRHVKRTAQRPVTSGAGVGARGAFGRGAGAGGLCPGADHQRAHGGLVVPALG